MRMLQTRTSERICFFKNSYLVLQKPKKEENDQLNFTTMRDFCLFADFVFYFYLSGLTKFRPSRDLFSYFSRFLKQLLEDYLPPGPPWVQAVLGRSNPISTAYKAGLLSAWRLLDTDRNGAVSKPAVFFFFFFLGGGCVPTILL